MPTKLIILALILGTAVGQNKPRKTEFTERLREFSGNMFRVVAETNNQKNSLFSPLSVYFTLGLLLEGAHNNTREQLIQRMGLKDIPQHRITNLMRKTFNNAAGRQNGQTFKIANAIFLQEYFVVNPRYLTVVKENYRASVDLVDFSNSTATARRINQWVENITENKIRDLIKPDMLSPLTKAVLANAVYFNAEWMTRFDEHQNISFHRQSKSTVSVPAMNRTDDYNVKYMHRYNIRLLAVPYKSSTKNTAFFVIGLSEDPEGEGFSSFQTNADRILRQMNSPAKWNSKEKINLIMPKFQITEEIDLEVIMTRLGIRDIFNPKDSDLSGIAQEPLYVSDFRHKVYMKVDKKGSEAAAASAAVITGRSATNDPEELKVDKPFVFGIYDTKAEVFTFLGKLNDPTQ